MTREEWAESLETKGSLRDANEKLRRINAELEADNLILRRRVTGLERAVAQAYEDGRRVGKGTT